MLKTVSSANSLIFWGKNENHSNIAASVFDGDEKILKKFYVELFKNVASQLSGNPDVFVQMWSDMCDRECDAVYDFIKIQLAIKNCRCVVDDDIKLVVNKFRGNAGEILIEALVQNGIINLGMPGTYEPVDPNHEMFVDATMEKDGLPIGIQIKNYNWKSNIHKEVLVKAAAMPIRWMQVDNLVKEKDWMEFLKSPSQYIISTCKPSYDLIVEDWKNVVVFLGPEYLDSLKIQGCRKTGEKSRYKIFEKIAEEIEAL